MTKENVAGKKANWPISLYHYARGLKDRPFLMLMGRHDTMCTPRQAETLYDLIPSMQKNLKFYNSAHQLPEDYVRDAAAWFRMFL